MKIKVLKVVCSGDTKTIVSLHSSYKKAVFTIAKWIENLAPDSELPSQIFEDVEIKVEEEIGANDEEWDDDDWRYFYEVWKTSQDLIDFLGFYFFFIEEEDIEIIVKIGVYYNES